MKRGEWEREKNPNSAIKKLMVITVIHFNAAYPELYKYEHTQIVTFASQQKQRKNNPVCIVERWKIIRTKLTAIFVFECEIS